MNRTRSKRAAVISLLLLALLIAAPIGMTWRVVRQERLNRALIEATRHSDGKAVIWLLEEGADPNCRVTPATLVSPWRVFMGWLHSSHSQQGSDAMTPLAYAAGGEAIEDTDLEQSKQPVASVWVIISDATENVALVRTLLKHGARIDMRVGPNRRTPLYYALRAGRSATVHLLLARGARIESGFLCLAIGKPDLVADLIAHGANVNAPLLPGDTTPLMEACSSGDVESVRLLLTHRAETDVADEDGRDALGFVREPDASATPVERINRREIVRLLKAAGAKP